MITKRKKSNTLTKKKSLKQLRREWEERESHTKNVSKKICKKYYNHYNEDNLQLKKINLDFKVSEKPFTKPTMDSIEEFGELNICPNIYTTLTLGNICYKEVNQKGITPGILLESIISLFFESQDRDINQIIIKKNSDQPCRYDIIDEFGRVIYIKLHTKSKVEYTKSKTGALLKYLKNKKLSDELIFKEYIKRFKKGFDSYVKSLKTEINTEKLKDDLLLQGLGYNNKKEIEIVLHRGGCIYGIVLRHLKNKQVIYEEIYSMNERDIRQAILPINKQGKVFNIISEIIPSLCSCYKKTPTNLPEIKFKNEGFIPVYTKLFRELVEKELTK